LNHPKQLHESSKQWQNVEKTMKEETWFCGGKRMNGSRDGWNGWCVCVNGSNGSV